MFLFIGCGGCGLVWKICKRYRNRQSRKHIQRTTYQLNPVRRNLLQTSSVDQFNRAKLTINGTDVSEE
jgi:hypothetical protein